MFLEADEDVMAKAHGSFERYNCCKRAAFYFIPPLLSFFILKDKPKVLRVGKMDYQ
jgi:hypothetical protein